MIFTKHELPLPEDLVDELIPFWTSIFGDDPPDFPREVFLGSEAAYNRGTLYMERIGGQLAGTCFIIRSKAKPTLAGFGEVATAPHFRGRGIASRLCRQALTDFRAAGGEAFFLGTVNPAAARVYKRLGWRKLAGANVMVNITSGASPEEFLVDFFRKPGQVTVQAADPGVRVPMVPLILTPHDHQVLDANVGLISCRYATQNSCMGLYPRYVRGLDGDRGRFFAAYTDDGRIVGLSSAILDGHGACQVDAFTHHNFSSAWPLLIEAACDWARAQGASSLRAVVSVEDEEKRAQFEATGFLLDGRQGGFKIGDREVSGYRLTFDSLLLPFPKSVDSHLNF